MENCYKNLHLEENPKNVVVFRNSRNRDSWKSLMIFKTYWKNNFERDYPRMNITSRRVLLNGFPKSCFIWNYSPEKVSGLYFWKYSKAFHVIPLHSCPLPPSVHFYGTLIGLARNCYLDYWRTDLSQRLNLSSIFPIQFSLAFSLHLLLPHLTGIRSRHQYLLRR